MLNEILLVEKVFNCVGDEVKNKDIDYLRTILSDDYQELIDILNLIETTTCTYLYLVKIHGTFLSLQKDLYDISNLIDYLGRKKHVLQEKIYIPFDYSNSIEHILDRAVDNMVRLTGSIPVRNCSHNRLKCVYSVLNAFANHGHYLPRLSQTSDEHRISDIVLYLRYINKVVHIVYENAVMQIVRKYPEEYIYEQ